MGFQSRRWTVELDNGQKINLSPEDFEWPFRVPPGKLPRITFCNLGLARSVYESQMSGGGIQLVWMKNEQGFAHCRRTRDGALEALEG